MKDLFFILSCIILYCFDSAPSVSGKWGQPKSDLNKQDCLGEHCHTQCYPTPFAMEGPFYVPGKPVRSDIREDRDGIPLELKLKIKDYHSNCKPVVNAHVHVWQPDALGVYSAYLGYYPLGKPGKCDSVII